MTSNRAQVLGAELTAIRGLQNPPPSETELREPVHKSQRDGAVPFRRRYPQRFILFRCTAALTKMGCCRNSIISQEFSG
jgi:hypothetical protein